MLPSSMRLLPFLFVSQACSEKGLCQHISTTALLFFSAAKSPGGNPEKDKQAFVFSLSKILFKEAQDCMASANEW